MGRLCWRPRYATTAAGYSPASQAAHIRHHRAGPVPLASHIRHHRAGPVSGYPDIGSFVLARAAGGASLAAISREAGLHKDWLSRHLGDLDPGAAAAVLRGRPARGDIRWLPVLNRLGYADVASYLTERHLVQHRTLNAIAAEVGMSHHAVGAALRRHGLAPTAHAAKRHVASERAARVAARHGFGSIASYITDRRAAGWTWRAMSGESGQPPSWLRRQAGNAQAARGHGTR